MSRSPSMTRLSSFAVLLLLLAGCVRAFVPGEGVYGGDRLDPRRDRDGVREPAKNAAVARKVVHGKESPATLVAPDGTRCTVTEKRFRDVREGDKVTCAWRSL